MNRSLRPAIPLRLLILTACLSFAVLLVVAFIALPDWLPNSSAPYAPPSSAARLLAPVAVSRDRGSHPIGWWIMDDFAHQEPTPNILVLGNSQLGGLRAADAQVAGRNLDFVLDHRGYALERALNGDAQSGLNRVFVASQPGPLVSDYYAMVRALITSDRKPDLVVLAVAPRDFMSNGLSYPGASQYFRFFSPLIDWQGALPLRDLAYPSLSSRFDSSVRQIIGPHVPACGAGKFVFLRQDKQRYKDIDIDGDCHEESLASTSVTTQLAFFEETIAWLRKAPCTVVVVSLPLLSTHQKSRSFTTELNGRIARTCAEGKGLPGACVSFLNLSVDKRFIKEDFLDPIHLSQAGGHKFANIVSNWIKTNNLNSRMPE